MASGGWQPWDTVPKVVDKIFRSRRSPEFGAAGIHIDDLAIGLKKFTVGQGRTVVPTSEYADRVKAIRLQLDIMGAETLLFARCDTDHAEFITSVVDPRDHEYVLGATKDVKPLQQVMNEAIASGKLSSRSQNSVDCFRGS
ncbi:unnamed protein product, partial [Clonostachys rosea f. rosea IK726]